MKKLTLLLLVVVSLAILIVKRTPAQTETPTTPIFPVYSTDGSNAPNAHMVVGQVKVPPGSVRTPQGKHALSGSVALIPVTLTGAAAFTNAETYKCFVSQLGGTYVDSGGTFEKIDGSHFGIRAPVVNIEWQQDFFCIGN